MKALDIIAKIGAQALSDCDGSCPCGSFDVAGIKVRFHCWRVCKECENSGVHVERSNHDGDEELMPIAEQVVKDLKEIWEHTDWEIRIKSIVTPP